MIELKPCKHCGQKRIATSRGVNGFFTACLNCGTATQIYTNAFEANCAWNRMMTCTGKVPASKPALTAAEAISAYAELCTEYSVCIYCPILSVCKTVGIKSCRELKKTHPEEVIKVLENWLESKKPKHKTIKDDFFEKYPNASKCLSGYPAVCFQNLYGERDCDHTQCEKCTLWDETIEGGADCGCN